LQALLTVVVVVLLAGLLPLPPLGHHGARLRGVVQRVPATRRLPTAGQRNRTSIREEQTHQHTVEKHMVSIKEDQVMSTNTAPLLSYCFLKRPVIHPTLFGKL
jgi:hypothetical protein